LRPLSAVSGGRTDRSWCGSHESERLGFGPSEYVDHDLVEVSNLMSSASGPVSVRTERVGHVEVVHELPVGPGLGAVDSDDFESVVNQSYSPSAWRSVKVLNSKFVG
jgi:hypothetical protein